MPKAIVTEHQAIETYPAPECNLTDQDVEQFVEELEHYARLFEPAFCRREQWKWGQVYLQGLLGDTPRKTAERIALELGENVRDLQHFIGQSPWQKACGGHSSGPDCPYLGGSRWGAADR